MKHGKRLLALALTVLLPGCGQETTPQPEAPAARTGVAAYVPLDDRPDNVERVVYLAESLGYELRMPDTELYATRLDGQPLNESGMQSGDRAALYEWVLEQEANGCDRYILSLDQLLSGGLVNSRREEGTVSVTLTDGRTLTEMELLDELLCALSADKRNQVWLLDSVMRLAPTVGYAGFGLAEYNSLREFGMLPRPALSGEALTLENILNGYWYHADGTEIAPEEPLSYGIATHYLAARERKLRLSAETQRVLSQPAYQNFHLLTGIDDSSAEDSIQKNEIAYLTARLREGDALLSGVDDLAFKAVTKLYLQDCGWQGATAQVTYFGGTENAPACAYDYQPLETIMQEHLDFFGLTRTWTDGAGDLEVLVLTQPADVSLKDVYIQALVDRLNANQKNGVPTILVDAANDTYGTAFHNALTEQTELGLLLSYSGFLDMAIVTGTALSHGVARYAWLRYGEPEDETANRAFARTLADSVIKDFCYRNTVRNDLYAYVRDTLGGSPDNFYNPPVDGGAVLSRLTEAMENSTKAVLKNFSRSNLIVGLEPYTEQGWGTLELSDWSFPWQRVFEIRMEIAVGSFTRPHQGWLG